MNTNDIVGGAAVLLFVFIFAFFTTPLGMAILGVVIMAAAVAMAWAFYNTYEPWTTILPSERGCCGVVAHGYMDKGHFVLSCAGVPDRDDGYPFILTLCVFNRRGQLVSAVAKLVRRLQDDGRFVIGKYWGRIVAIDVNHRQAWFVDFGEPNGWDTWQVFPPTPDVPSWLTPC